MNYTFHWAPALKAWPQLLWGAVVTLEIAVLSMILGVMIAIALALFSKSNSKLLRGINSVWVELARNTPALFQVYMVYFGLGSLGLRLDSYPSLVVGITFNCAGYLAEAFRGGLRAIPETQVRAARSLGMSAPKVFIFIVLPQLFRIVFYPITNQMVWAILMTSLGVVVGLTNDLMGVTQQMSVVTFRTFEYFALAAILYYALAKFVTLGAGVLARRLFQY
ncbi:amino acid ABC transporter permease (plasmid) [Rhizobium sp. 32-5/1]|uniref:amino acid ABC transporter permease n=1 Tax=Rhizobium sp. 32-5/1 TaxID=3019602 RepID=UPI00240D4865|nr:amino acid ABC transporter permease [Rhizobium sp. 32-5/1]WEZ85484.1 amino acid ABC transporter permease [Rhizobium sp. 32-5/1]